MTPKSREKKCVELGRAGLAEVPAQLHGATQPWRCVDSQRLPSSLGRLSLLWQGLSSPSSSSLCPLLTQRRFSRDLTPSCPFSQTISSLHLHMLVPAVVPCLPSEGRGLHFSDCLARFHPCIVTCYMPCCKDSISTEL